MNKILNMNDKNNKKLGYEIKEGRKKLITETINLQKGRGKKKDLNQSENMYIKNNHSLKTISNSRVVSKSDYFSGEYSQYLCFSVFCSTNKLVSDRNKHLWSEEQQKTHDLIKSLHDSGMGYRKISHHLNE